MVVLLLAGSCTGPAIPPPATAPRIVSAPTVPQVARPVPAVGWQDMAIAPGEWRWSREGGAPVARFGSSGQTLAQIACRAGTVTLTRYGGGEAMPAAPTMIIRTTSTSRPGAGVAQAGAVSLALGARDPLLDAIAFSRGRFAIEVQGMAPMALPSWPEVARVIDDCRG